jgi:hypothetical protein
LVRDWAAQAGKLADKHRFVDLIADRILGILNNEPSDIYVNPMYLPDAMAEDYDELWTPERIPDKSRPMILACRLSMWRALSGSSGIRSL